MTREELINVKTRLGGGIICDRCDATLESYGEKCSAALDDPCPGFRAVEGASRAMKGETVVAKRSLVGIHAALDRNRLPMWVVYDHPKDMPEVFVARLHYALPTPEPSGWVIAEDNIDRLRGEFGRLGLVQLARSPNDDPVIMETWLL